MTLEAKRRKDLVDEAILQLYSGKFYISLAKGQPVDSVKIIFDGGEVSSIFVTDKKIKVTGSISIFEYGITIEAAEEICYAQNVFVNEKHTAKDQCFFDQIFNSTIRTQIIKHIEKETSEENIKRFQNVASYFSVQ